ncbi:MAG: four helix bundle protein [bacterium]|nr:four helix bundle protein [bacterium]
MIEKTIRQAQSLQGYKASAAWQTASLLRDLILLYCHTLPKAQFRRRTQLEDATRSMVANIEEGWARPSTKEYLDFLGFSQGSLTEVRGDIERLLTDGLIKAGIYGKRREGKGLTQDVRILTPSRNFPYPPVKSRVNPGKYGTLRERLREYTGSDIRKEDLIYEVFVELINKTDYLIARAVEGLQEKIVREEKQKLKLDLERIRRGW